MLEKRILLALMFTCAGTAMAVPNPEVEDNNNKATATVANSGGPGMAAGDTITGFTTGTSTLTAGNGSADYFRVKTAAAPLGIYRNRLSLISIDGPNTYAATIRGLTQSAAGINTASDAVLQTAQSSTTTPTRFVQWYGFGKQEEIYYRVTGGTTTIGTYESTLIVEPVTPIVASGIIVPGNISISRGAGNTADVDFWVFDANLDPVPDFGVNGPNTATRALSAGTYYVAWSNVNTATNQGSSSTETTLTDAVLDFPNVVTNSSTLILNSNTIQIGSAAGQITIDAPKPSAFEVAWVQFTVAEPTSPTPIQVVAGSSSLTRTGAPIGAGTFSSLITANVAAGLAPASTNLVVTVNLTSVGGGAAAAMFDDGSNGDVAAGDGIYSLAIDSTAIAAGAYTLTVSATDAQGRSSQSDFSLTLADNAVTNLGLIPRDTTVVSSTVSTTPGLVKWFRFTTDFDAITPGSYIDFWTLPGTITDTEIGIYRADGTLVGSDDDDGEGLYSAMSFGRTTPTRPLTGGVAHNGRDGELLAGEYYLALVQYNATFGTAGFGVTTTGTAAGDMNINISGLGGPTAPTGTGTASPATVLNDGSSNVRLTFNLLPGANPTTSGHIVTVNAAGIGAGTVTLLDDGVAPDAAAGDNIFTATATVAAGTAVGAVTLPVSITTSDTRVGTGSIALTVREPLGACCLPAGCNVVTLTECVTAGGTFLGDGITCTTQDGYLATTVTADLEDISATGTLVTNTGDDGVTAVTLGFAFPFYGTPTTDISVSTNGNIQFVAAGASTAFTNGNLPSAVAPNGAIYACWDDFNFNVNAGDGIYSETRGTAGVDLRHIIQWHNVSQFGGVAETEFNTFQIILFESGTFEIRYGTMTPSIFAGDDSTVGVENADGTVATQIDESSLASGSALRFVYALGTDNCPSAPACLADIAGGDPTGGDGSVDGTDFIAFINSFGIGDASVDPAADVAGGVPSGPDGTIDGTDFIEFINAFGAGC
jgi:hypothetical protein